MQRKRRLNIGRIGATDVAELRATLGPYAARFTEAQLQQLDRELTIGASLLVELYLQNRRAQRMTNRRIDGSSPDA